MIEELLIKQIVEETNLILITKLDEETKQALKEHIQKTILDRYNYKPFEKAPKLIDEVIEQFESGLQAIGDIYSINLTISDTFFNNLKEDIELNKRTFDDISFSDGVNISFDDVVNLELKGLKNFPYKYRDDFISKEIENFLQSIKKEKNELTERENSLIKYNAFINYEKDLKLRFKGTIADKYKIINNHSQVNQIILDNSYTVIMDTLKRLPNTDDIVILLENEKSINNDLFTNSKKLSKVKIDNHYMSFLYKCNSVYAENDLIVFQEFVEALISGYMQFLEFDNKEQKIKSYKQDLEVLKRYNTSKENDKNIQELEDSISFLSISKPHQKFIPFKELSNRLEIDKNQIANYITNILNNGTHKNTIKQSFDSLKTIPKEICISKF